MLYNNEIPITCINSEKETDLTAVLNSICKSYSSGKMFIKKIFIDKKLNKNIRNHSFLDLSEFDMESSGNILIVDPQSINRLLELDKFKNNKKVVNLKVFIRSLKTKKHKTKRKFLKKLYDNNKIIYVSKNIEEFNIPDKKDRAILIVKKSIKNNIIASSYLKDVLSNDEILGKIHIEIFNVENGNVTNCKYGYNKRDLRKVPYSNVIQFHFDQGIYIYSISSYVTNSDKFWISKNSVYRMEDKSISKAIDVLEEA